MRWRCVACGQREAGEAPSLCICGLSGTFEPAELERPAGEVTPDAGPRARPLSGTDAELARWRTRERGFDRALEGGPVRGSTVSVYGPAGVGKSTLCYRWASGVGRVLLVTPEMPRALVLATAKRAGVRLERANHLHDLERWRSEAMRLRARAVVIDSLSSGSPASILAELREWSAQSDGVGWAIAHESKDGAALGPVAITYDPDAVIRVGPGKKRGFVRVTVEKCRYAPSSAFEVRLVPRTSAGSAAAQRL